jgi:hypothetical protein
LALNFFCQRLYVFRLSFVIVPDEKPGRRF